MGLFTFWNQIRPQTSLILRQGGDNVIQKRLVTVRVTKLVTVVVQLELKWYS